MSISKTGIVLCALLLATMAMAPLVNAIEYNATGQTGSNGNSVPPEHHIPPEYFKDAKPATPLPESEMMKIILSEKTLTSFSKENPAGIITLPASLLNDTSRFTESGTGQNRFVERDISPDDAVVLVRMPKTMYDRFLETSTDGKISFPALNFARYYKNLADLDAGIPTDGNAEKRTPDMNSGPAEKTDVPVAEKKEYTGANRLTSGTGSLLVIPQYLGFSLRPARAIPVPEQPASPIVPVNESRCNPQGSGSRVPAPADTSLPVRDPMPGIRYSLNESDSGRTIEIGKGDLVEINLPWIPGPGFHWIVPVSGCGLELLNDGTYDTGTDFRNTSGHYRARYRAVSPGRSFLDGKFVLVHEEEGDLGFNLTVIVK